MRKKRLTSSKRIYNAYAAATLSKEHEHDEHPDYKFPVHAVWCGPKSEDPGYWIDGDGKKRKMSKAEAACFTNELHALIYTDGFVAVTLYEYCYAIWTLRPHIYRRKKMPAGMCVGGNLWKKNEWKLTRKSVNRIKKLAKA
jgi:hypothetical protein